MHNLTKITLAWELHEAGVMKQDIAARLAVNRDTIRLWINGIAQYGLLPFLDHYANAKKGPRRGRQVDPILERWIWVLRDREADCCGQKIQYFLRELFAFTGVDIYTREADILIAPELTAHYGSLFLTQSMARRFNGHVHLLQTDGGPEFKEEFKDHVRHFCDRHRIARPYRKNKQAFIESFNRSLRKECVGWRKYRSGQLEETMVLVEGFLDRYHYHRPHMGENDADPSLFLEQHHVQPQISAVRQERG